MLNNIKDKVAKSLYKLVVIVFFVVTSTTVSLCGGTYFQAWYSNACTQTQHTFMGINNGCLFNASSNETAGAAFILSLLVLIGLGLAVKRYYKNNGLKSSKP